MAASPGFPVPARFGVFPGPLTPCSLFLTMCPNDVILTGATPFYRRDSGGTERLSDLLKVTQQPGCKLQQTDCRALGTR